MDTQNMIELHPRLRDYPVNQKFYLNHKCYVKNDAGQIEEVPGMPVKKVYEIRKELSMYFSKKVHEVVRMGCQHNGTKYHAAEVKVNKKNKDCVKGDYPDMWFDFSQVSLTYSVNGHYLEGLPDGKVTGLGDWFTLSWSPVCSDIPGLSEKNDQLMLLLFNFHTQTFTSMFYTEKRENASVIFYPANTAYHHEFTGWAFFVSKCKQYASETCFLGIFSKNMFL